MKTTLTYPKNLTRYFEKKVITDCCHLDVTIADTKNCLNETTGLVLKVTGMKFRKSLRNISHSTFSPQ